jgi:hypothetical protein
VNVRLRQTTGLAFAALLASSGTLICCVLPAAMVALGAGATLAGLVGAFPQLVWLSEHKPLVFGGAALLLVASGVALLRARRLPCPAEPRMAAACRRLRKISGVVYALALLAFATGTAFAFVLPWLTH